MSDKHKPIQTPFDKTVPDLEEETNTDTFGEERVRDDLGIGSQEKPAPGEDRVREEVAIEREERAEEG